MAKENSVFLSLGRGQAVDEANMMESGPPTFNTYKTGGILGICFSLVIFYGFDPNGIHHHLTNPPFGRNDLSNHFNFKQI